MMKLMRVDLLPCTAEHVVMFCCKRYIAEANQLPLIFACAGQRPHHRPPFNRFREVHEPTAFRNARHSTRKRGSDGAAHGNIPGELLQIKLRIPAA